MEVQQVMVRTAERRGEKVRTSRHDSWVPTPEEIRQRTAEIRRGWSAEMRQQREVPLPGLPLIPILLGMEVPEIRHR
jgi:hypothetical protein